MGRAVGNVLRRVVVGILAAAVAGIGTWLVVMWAGRGLIAALGGN